MIGIPNRIGRGLLGLALAVWTAAAGAAQPTLLEADALHAAVAAEQQRPRAPRLPRIAFLARSNLLGAWLSPDGTRVAWMQDHGRNRSVWISNTNGGAPVRVLAQTEAGTLAWSHDGRWLFLEAPRQVFALAVAGQGGSRAIAKLGGRWPRALFGVDPSRPSAVTIIESPPVVSRLPRKWRVYRVDAQGRQTLLHEDAREVVDLAFDARGRIAFLVRVEGEGYVVLRARGTSFVPALRCVDLRRCELLSASADGREAFLMTDVDSDLRRVARLDAANGLHTLAVDPRGEADVVDVALDPANGTPLIAGYRSTIAASHGITPDVASHVAAIEARYPDHNLRIEVGRGPRAQWLVHDRAPTHKGERLHLYDPQHGAFRDLAVGGGVQYREKPAPVLPETALARKIAFTWRASDGLPIHGFVHVPPGVDAARAPIVAYVHGGPFSLFRPEFMSTSQLLANRGYVVFEPNFRGSTGHGRAYMRAGHGDFGNGRVQQDIVEGVRVLAANGIGDVRRAAIVGTSFGGYAALQGVTFQPELFRAAAAAVPPADLGWVLRWYSRSVDQMSTGIPLATSMRLLALDPADQRVRERLRAESPIANVQRVSRPVLLLAGADDERVPIRSVMHYAAALKLHGKDASLLVDPEGRHQLEDPRTREAYFYLIERLLHRRLGGAAPEAPNAGLRGFIDRNMLLRGSDFE
jgi:dipeptidyl aminopeptidase/acylaminoacyl peptidase